MTTSNTLTQTLTEINTPPGADPIAHAKWEQAKRRILAGQTKRRRTNGQARSTKAKQAAAICKALAVTVQRVNGEKMTAIEQAQRQAIWEAANPADDYGLQLRRLEDVI